MPPPLLCSGVLVLLLLSVCAPAFAKVDFCADNNLPASNWSSNLQFTNELSQCEYAVQSKFKSLHCCAKGYRSIEWFKDGKAYPWPGDISTFILYPESANQTIYTQSLKMSDAGNYTCRAHNDTLRMEHNTLLTVFDHKYSEKPLITYKPPAVSNASVGKRARLFCEAFVGHISLPDATNEVIWSKSGNESFMDSRMHLEHVQRESGQIVGAYLIIENVEKTDFGKYTCTISNTGDQKIFVETNLQAWSETSPPLCLWGRLMTILFCVSAAIITLILIIYTLKIIMRDNHTVSSILGKLLEKSPFTDTTPRKLGLVLLYGEEDTDIVENSVIPELKEKYSYNVFPQKLTSEGTVSEESKELINKVGRVMVVLTEKVIKEWTEFNVIAALQKIIPPQQHCVLTAEPMPDYVEKLQCSNFDFEKNINRYKVVMWSGDFEGSKNKLFTSFQEVLIKPSDNCPKSTVTNYNEQKKDGESFLAKIHLKRSKPSPEAHV